MAILIYAHKNSESFNETINQWASFLHDEEKGKLSLNLPPLKELLLGSPQTDLKEDKLEKPDKPVESRESSGLGELREHRDEPKPVEKITTIPVSTEPAVEEPSLSIAELEKNCRIVAAEATKLYQEAVSVIKNYNGYVSAVVEGSQETADGEVWERLQKATQQKHNIVAELEKETTKALRSLNRYSDLIKQQRFKTAPDLVNTASQNVQKLLEDVHAARSKYENAVKSGSIVEKYWTNVKTARDAFNEELRILFPNVNIEKKELLLNDDVLDLFLVYIYKKMNNLQHELAKARSFGEMTLKSALSSSGEDGIDDKVGAMIDLRVQNEQHAMFNEFNKMLLEKQKYYADKLRQQLKIQAQVHMDHLAECLKASDEKHEADLKRLLNEQETSNEAKSGKLAAVVGRIRALEAVLREVLEEERKATNLQILWSSCQAMTTSLKHGPPDAASRETITPFAPLVATIRQAAPTDDPLLKATIESIPEEATKRGVYPERTLRQRFLKVEKVAKQLAMIPAEGAALPMYLLSYLQSLLIIDSGCAITQKELKNDPIDPTKLNTFDILNRARYWIDQGDFKMCLRYMNLLQGAPRSIAREWMKEVRILLETQQAVDIFNAYAGALGVMLINAGKRDMSRFTGGQQPAAKVAAAAQ